MDLGLRGKRALVMGASSGLGRAVAAALAHEGAQVAVCSRDEGRIQAAAKQVGSTLAVVSDLSRPNAGRAAVEKVLQVWGSLDILVCNTGGPPTGAFQDVSAQQWQEGFQSLWLSAVDSINAALPGMRRSRWGRVLLVTSAAAKEPIPGLTVSNGLRAGLLGLCKSLSHEVAHEGVTINCLLPGYTATERMQQLGVDTEKMAAQIPAKRLGRPEELAAAAAFLASEQAAYITGQALAIDGGYLHGH
jgi:3-oxoacyl-[acyl-carrier protein] reductase